MSNRYCYLLASKQVAVNKINQNKQHNYLMPNAFKCFQGITAAAGAKCNRNWNALLNTRILDQPVRSNEKEILLKPSKTIYSPSKSHAQTYIWNKQKLKEKTRINISYLRHWGRVRQICLFNTRLFSLHNTLNYATHRACLRMVLLTDVYRNLTSLWIKL